MQIDLGPDAYRSVDPAPKPRVRFTLFEAMSFAIGSTLATRKKAEPDPDRVGRLMQAGFLGWVWYITHHGP